MEQINKKAASAEYVAEKVAKLTVVFYDTPNTLFDELAKTILFLEMTEREVSDMIDEAIFTVKKTRITIADVINGREKQNKKTVAYV